MDLNEATTKNLLRKRCGIKSFYIPRSHPDEVSVNARCLDPDSRVGMTITEFAGQNREKHYPKGRAERYPE